MKSEREDDRTDEQKKTHRFGVIGHDRFLSGWGGAKGGKSIAIWACHPDVNIDRVEKWVRNRGEMRRVRVISIERYRPSRGVAHCHVYVCDPGHPATQE